MPNDVKAKLIALAICEGTEGPVQAAEITKLVVEEVKRLVHNFNEMVQQLQTTTPAQA